MEAHSLFELPDGLRDAAEKDLPANKKMFDKLRRSKPARLDDQFHQLHYEVFEHTDCLQCANCCKTTSPIFYQKDIERVARHLRMRPADFADTYLCTDEDGDCVLRTAPCPFLDADNYCSVYESRPTACREYPHTNRKRMSQILSLTLRNTAVCPAVYVIVEKLRQLHP